MAENYGLDGWSDKEQLFFDQLMKAIEHTPHAILLSPQLFDELLDMMTRFPAVPSWGEEEGELVLTNQAVCDPQDPQLHLYIRRRKFYRTNVTAALLEGSHGNR